MNRHRATDFPRRVGRAIKQRREALDLTQEQLAERVDMHPDNYTKLEHGKVNFTLITLERLSEALEAQPWEVLKDAASLLGTGAREVVGHA